MRLVHCLVAVLLVVGQAAGEQECGFDQSAQATAWGK
jgi:hypothetical protein